ncbi:MAG: oligosaccharide flippase family protein [Tepidisphaera sp.]
MPDFDTQPDADSMPVPKPMGQTVSVGAIWMAMATIVGKGASFIAQIMLGLILVEEHFALFAYATAATKLLSICQDAGVKDLMIQEGPGRYRALSGPIFWFAAAFNSSVALFIAALTPVVAWYYDEPRLQPMMWVLLLAIPLGTPAAILYTKLRLDLRFRETSFIVAIAAILRQFGQVALALAGSGAMSFVYPAVAAAVIESVLTWWVTRDHPWSRPAEPRQWPGLIGKTKYLILGSVANLLLDQGPYLVLQPSLRLLGGMAKGQADGIQGNVFWAFQMTAQVGVLLSYNMQLVLGPVFQKISEDPKRLRRSVLRAMAAMMMIGSITSIGFGLVMDPLEKMVFQGKWAAATAAVAIYGLFFPFRILYGLTAALQLATGQSRAYFYSTLIPGLVFTFAAVAAGRWVDTPAGAAWWTGGALAAIMILVTLQVLRKLGVPAREAIVEMCWPWLLAVLAGGVGFLLDTHLPIESMVTRKWELGELVSLQINPVGGWWDNVPAWLAARDVSVGAQARILEAIRFFLLGTSCAVSFIVLARFFMPDIMREFLNAMPKRIGKPIQKLMLIRDAVDPV